MVNASNSKSDWILALVQLARSAQFAPSVVQLQNLAAILTESVDQDANCLACAEAANGLDASSVPAPDVVPSALETAPVGGLTANEGGEQMPPRKRSP